MDESQERAGFSFFFCVSCPLCARLPTAQPKRPGRSGGNGLLVLRALCRAGVGGAGTPGSEGDRF